MQLVIAVKYFENCTSNTWELKMNGFKVANEVKEKGMWMEQQSNMISLQWFCLH